MLKIIGSVCSESYSSSLKSFARSGFSLHSPPQSPAHTSSCVPLHRCCLSSEGLWLVLREPKAEHKSTGRQLYFPSQYPPPPPYPSTPFTHPKDTEFTAMDHLVIGGSSHYVPWMGVRVKGPLSLTPGSMPVHTQSPLLSPPPKTCAIQLASWSGLILRPSISRIKSTCSLWGTE